ncbi:response regulator transcription factor, partial [Vibrio vulnificus]|uniref:response regulator transcription factor n=1 Tax=Vibrio vulnificus TaxID=672 RepID=UPI000A697005
ITTNTKQILDCVREENVELIIMDVLIEGRDGISLAKSIFANGYAGKLLFVSSNDYDSLSNVAYTIGAHGYLTKYASQSTLSNAIVNVLKGYTMFKGQPAQSDQQALSEREVTVLSYLMQGYSNQKISELLMLSNKTISCPEKQGFYGPNLLNGETNNEAIYSHYFVLLSDDLFHLCDFERN